MIVAVISTAISEAENIVSFTSWSDSAINALEGLFYIIELLLFSSFYIGFYRYCFSRIEKEKKTVAAVFDFYKKERFWKAVAANNFALIPVLISALVILPVTAIASSFIFSVRGVNHGAVNYLLFLIVIALIVFAVTELFFLTPYAYAKNPDEGVIQAAKRSVRLCKKVFAGLMLLHFAEIALLYGFGRLYFSVINGEIYIGLSFPIFYAIKIILELIFGAFSTWLNITIAYLILDRESKIVLENTEPDETIVIDDTEDEPFIKPYDFFIEADERYNAVKTVETENIRGLDILKIFEEMELSFDVINYLGIRKKLKKLFDQLAFDIDEYVSYEGGRSVEGSDSDEIDDVELEIYVEISRQSDKSPFVVTVKISEM